jgi:thiamine pyrophosphokinase
MDFQFKNALILANGSYDDLDYYKSELKKFDLTKLVIIACDGAYHIAEKLELKLDFLIGEMDSISPTAYTRLISTSATAVFKNISDCMSALKNNLKVINDPDQNKTDYLLAFELARALKLENILVWGAFGGRQDHSLANILELSNFNELNIILNNELNSLSLVKSELLGVKNSSENKIKVIDEALSLYIKNTDTGELKDSLNSSPKIVSSKNLINNLSERTDKAFNKHFFIKKLNLSSDEDQAKISSFEPRSLKNQPAYINHYQITGSKDEYLSILPLTEIQALSVSAVKYPLEGACAQPGSRLISNKLMQEQVELSFKSGTLLVIKATDQYYIN